MDSVTVFGETLLLVKPGYINWSNCLVCVAVEAPTLSTSLGVSGVVDSGPHYRHMYDSLDI